MKAETLKGHLDVLVLAVFRDGPLHGYAVIDALRQRSEGAFELAEGTVYPVLHRLEADGLLASAWTVAAARRRRLAASLGRRGGIPRPRSGPRRLLPPAGRVRRGRARARAGREHPASGHGWGGRAPARAAPDGGGTGRGCGLDGCLRRPGRRP